MSRRCKDALVLLHQAVDAARVPGPGEPDDAAPSQAAPTVSLVCASVRRTADRRPIEAAATPFGVG